MSPRLAAVCVVGLAAVALPAAASSDALAAIDACTEHLQGADPVAVRCPELAQTLQASPWAAWLPLGWQDQYENLSARSLAALRVGVARELALRTSASAPQTALLRPILADLESRKEHEPRTWWERLSRWLRGFAVSEPAGESEAHWYERLLGHAQLSEVLLRWAAYVTLALVVILAAWIVLAEWRVARSARGGAAHAGLGLPHPAQAGQGMSWQQIERAPPEDRLRMLFALIVERLMAARRLPAARALTVRQLARSAQLADSTDRERLADVVFTVERQRFAVAPPSPASLARALTRGHELLESLGEAPLDSASHGQSA
ncbi:MAG TPA: hypothetical protein VIH50_08415 [Steroidobacteraceae bacterium]